MGGFSYRSVTRPLRHREERGEEQRGERKMGRLCSTWQRMAARGLTSPVNVMWWSLLLCNSPDQNCRYITDHYCCLFPLLSSALLCPSRLLRSLRFVSYSSSLPPRSLPPSSPLFSRLNRCVRVCTVWPSTQTGELSLECSLYVPASSYPGFPSSGYPGFTPRVFVFCIICFRGVLKSTDTARVLSNEMRSWPLCTRVRTRLFCVRPSTALSSCSPVSTAENRFRKLI